MNETYARTYLLTAAEADAFGNCRPAALLTMFQDMATEHGALMQVHRDYLMENYNAIWMLARLWYRLDRPLKMGDEVTIVTYHRGPGGMTVYRDFDLYVDGKSVGEGVSAWVIAVVDSRKMLRTNSVENIANSPVPEQVKDKTLRGIRSPKERAVAYCRTIRFSDLDINGHMNNTKYADLVLDTFGPDDLKGKYLAELQLNFSRECLYGDTVEVGRCEVADGIYVDGCGVDGERHFEAIVSLQAEE